MVVGERNRKIHSPKWPSARSKVPTDSKKYLLKYMKNQRGTLNQHKHVHSHPNHTAVPRFQVDLEARSQRKLREFVV